MLTAKDSDCRMLHLSFPEPQFVLLIYQLQSARMAWKFC